MLMGRINDGRERQGSKMTQGFWAQAIDRMEWSFTEIRKSERETGIGMEES